MKAAAFFDLDGALLAGDVQFAFLAWRWARRLGLSSRARGIAARCVGDILGCAGDAIRLETSGFAFLGNVPVQLLEEDCAEFFATVLLYRLRRQAEALIETHRAQGHMTVLLASACEPLASPVAAWLRVDALIATPLLASGGRYVGPRELPEPRGPGRRALVERFCERRNLSRRDSFAYADHPADAPLLDWVGHPVAANPSRGMRRLARAREWPVLDLDEAALPQSFLRHLGRLRTRAAS
jgi:HAD superfamily hydrolase (TIGR01490 family)